MNTAKAGQMLKFIWGYGKIIVLNSFRRLLILWRYLLICRQQRKLKKAWRLLGRRVTEALDQGEVNPMLTEEVKDSLPAVQAAKEAKERHYQAIAAIRERIRGAWDAQFPPEPASAPPAEETPSGPEAS